MLANFFNFIFRNKDLPRWIVNLNYICLAGIIAWPLVLFVSIFLFDHPNNLAQTYLIFILMNCYPLVLIVLTWFSFKTFRFNRILSALFPLVVICGYLFVLFMMLFFG